MKGGACPKCGSGGVHVVDSVQLSVPVGAASVAPLCLYVCAGCGYAELYVRDGELLPKIAARYVSVAELREALAEPGRAGGEG